MRGMNRLLTLFAIGKPLRAGFLDLPYELRLQIYRYCLADCYVRYYQEHHLTGRHMPVKRDHCHGPKEHNLLATCRLIYKEGRDFLLSHPPYVIIDDVDAGIALYRMGSLIQSPFLQMLISSTHKLVLSKPAEVLRYIPRPGDLIPNFTNLKEVEIFGFYPDLNKWLYRDRIIAMGWSNFQWKLGWWRSTRRATKTRRIHLSVAAQWVHDITGKSQSEVPVTLRAWMFEVNHGATKWVNLTHMVVDLDRKVILEQERIQGRKRKDKQLHFLGDECQEYQHFRKATEKRRKAWLEQDSNRA